MTLFLLRSRSRLWWAALRRGRGRGGRAMGLVATLLVLLVVLPLVYVLVSGTTRALAEDDAGLARSILTIPFAAIVLVMLLRGTAAVLHRLYLATDLDLLLAGPVSLRSLFIVKLLECAGVAAGTTLFAAVTTIAYGRAQSAPPAFYALALVLLPLVALASTALSMILVMLLTRLIPAGRIQGLLVLAGSVIAAAAWLLLQGTSGGRLTGGSGDFESLIANWDARLRWLPSTWAARALEAVEDGELGVAVGFSALLFAVTAGLVGVALALFLQTFYVGKGRAAGVAARRTAERAGGDGLLARLLRPLPPWMAAVAIKDWRSLPRDLRLMSRLVFPLVMGGFFAAQWTTRMRDGDGELWLGLLGVPLALLVVAPTLPALTLGQEGRSFALLRLAPLSGRQLVAAKVASTALPVLALGMIAVVALGVVARSSGQLLVLALTTSWYAGGAIAGAVGGAMLSTDLEADDPQKRIGCLGQFASALTAAFFLVASATLFVTAAALLRGELTLPRPAAAAALGGSAVLVVAASAVVFAVGAAGARAIERSEVT